MFEKKRFTLTEDHIKLIRRMCVGWQHCEYGAPEINPKRPYGNSSVEGDIYEILGWVDMKNLTEDEEEDLFDGRGEFGDLAERAMVLHRETETALQIVLRIGSFTPGIYEADSYSNDWKLVE